MHVSESERSPIVALPQPWQKSRFTAQPRMIIDAPTTPAENSEFSILLIEDEPAHVALLRCMFAQAAHPFLIEDAPRMEDACKRLQAGGIDLILTDLSLPDSRPQETLPTLRTLFPDVPTIILSGVEDEEIAVRMVEQGAQDYLLKSRIEPATLMRSVRYALERHRCRADLQKAHDELDKHVTARTAELTHTAAQLETALEQLKQAQQRVVQQERLHALGRMASGIAHDFNNALAPIIGFSELLLNPNSTAQKKSQEYLRLIHMAATDGAEVVRRLREFYRYRDEHDVFTPVRLNDIVQQVIAITKPRWKDQTLGRGAQIQIVTKLDHVPAISGSEAELRELLINLMFNAVDAIEGDGTVTFRTFRRGASVALQISDTGVGMSEEVRLRCLEPFFSTKADHGTGLGLAMVFGIIRRHDGEIEIESTPESGTTITLSFVPHDETKFGELTRIPANVSRPLRILVVDDEPSIREVLGAILSEDSHEVVTAVDGRAGLEAFRSSQWDLVLTDRAMPHMNGDQLASIIKTIDPHVPVILVTGFADVMNDVGDHPSAIDVVVRKPFTRDSLRTAIAQVIVHRPPEDAADVARHRAAN